MGDWAAPASLRKAERRSQIAVKGGEKAALTRPPPIHSFLLFGRFCIMFKKFTEAEGDH